MHGRVKEILFTKGFALSELSLPSSLISLTMKENFQELYHELNRLFAPGSDYWNFLQDLHSFKNLELMLALRDANNPDEEEGIWHDDGSRLFAFSLSLNLEPENIEGGKLYFRSKSSSEMLSISPLPWGHIALFLSGEFGYEHRVGKVTKGKRLILAGWCS